MSVSHVPPRTLAAAAWLKSFSADLIQSDQIIDYRLGAVNLYHCPMDLGFCSAYGTNNHEGRPLGLTAHFAQID
jgi:hypothetical protein